MTTTQKLIVFLMAILIFMGPGILAAAATDIRIFFDVLVILLAVAVHGGILTLGVLMLRAHRKFPSADADANEPSN